MPSKKKKTKGRARGAAKSRKDLSKEKAANEVTQDEDALLEEAINLAAAEREQLEATAKNDEENNEERCNHGFSPWPRGHVCGRFISSLVREFIARSRDGHSTLDIFMEAHKATQKYTAVWKNPDMIELVMSHFLAEGASAILQENDDIARQSATFAIGLEQFRDTLTGNIDVRRSYGKITELTSDTCDEHTLVSFFRKRIPCKCLDKRYKEVKSIVKMGLCMNLACPLPDGQVERSKLMKCEQCRYMQYCSSECQKADWPLHKETCKASIAMVASFNSSTII